jgi:hypothetical protein
MPNEPIAIDGIVAAFKFNKGVYAREMVEAAIGRQAEITPRLIEILQGAIEDPQSIIDNRERFDHIYALMLLGHLKSVEAHPVIIKLFHLPEDTIIRLYDDILTNNLPTVLANTCGGDIEPMKSLVVDPGVYDFVRISALKAIAYAVADNMALRDEAVAFMGTLFTGEEPVEDPDFWGMIAPIACDLYPEEITPVIENAYEKDLISQSFIDHDSFRQTLQNGKTATLDKLRAERKRFDMNDLHAYRGNWRCFQAEKKHHTSSNLQEPFPSPLYAPSFPQTKVKLSGETKKKKKQKRKQAKVSKRKNR